MRYQTTLTLAVFNSLCLGLVALGFAYGFLGPIFHDDVSKLSSFCMLLLGVVIVHTTRKGLEMDNYRCDVVALSAYPHLAGRIAEEATNFADFIKNKVFLYVGLTGTVIGLTMVIFAMDVGSAADIGAVKAMIAGMKESMKTAFYATGVGILCKLWTEVLTFILGNAGEQICKDVMDIHARAVRRVEDLRGAGYHEAQ